MAKIGIILHFGTLFITIISPFFNICVNKKESFLILSHILTKFAGIKLILSMYFSRQKYLLLLVLLAAQWLSPQLACAQETINQTDTISLSTDSIATSPQKKEKKSSIDFPISYKANDSIVLSGSGNAYLYGEGNVNYEAIELQADYIKVDMDSSTIYAIGRENEEGEIVGPPDFKDGDDVYKSKSIRYNINTKKGFIQQALVQQGEGFIIGEETKKVENEIVCMKNGKYTTCDNHDHPHFYLNLTKAKVKQKRWVVTGPAYLVLLDVPLPLAIPFGYFPFTKQYSSGVIMPSYGTELTRGFYLANGGYYFAISDYADLALTGDIYSMGSWALYANSSYVKKYSFRGSLNMNYRVDVIGEKELPDYSRTKNLSINWRHAQDQKASPNSTLSASVNFSSSGYDRANINNYANPALLSQNTKSSSVSWGYRFPDSPFSLSTNILANQRTSDSTITLTLPDITFTMSRIYPLKRKNAIGKDRWYEKISMSYNGQFSNIINAIKQDQLMQSSIINDWKNGFNHTIPVNMTFNVLKYISISPNVNYHERWYMKSIEESYNQAIQEVEKDTTNGFYRVYDFNVGVNASTKLYGFFTPWRKLFGDKIDRIRHVMTPTIGYSYKPDFGDPYWNYYKT
ncbi:MAG: putative LPS assembly protein LptD, partial [Bacteroidales bacterium]|nr:putative LPS assembly protein LptD [Bacteroidales bacterium]